MAKGRLVSTKKVGHREIEVGKKGASWFRPYARSSPRNSKSRKRNQDRRKAGGNSLFLERSGSGKKETIGKSRSFGGGSRVSSIPCTSRAYNIGKVTQQECTGDTAVIGGRSM